MWQKLTQTAPAMRFSMFLREGRKHLTDTHSAMPKDICHQAGITLGAVVGAHILWHKQYPAHGVAHNPLMRPVHIIRPVNKLRRKISGKAHGLVCPRCRDTKLSSDKA